MKITIVTVSFNQARFLERSILSVASQDHPDVEHIVIDPGSTDGSREIIDRYRDKIAKIVFEPDNGAADGLNKGFRLATGDVFGFLNSDDELLPGALRKIAGHFSEHPETDILMGNTYIIDEESRRLRRSYTDRFEPRLFAYSAGITCQQGAFFRSDLYRKTKGFNVDNRITWDAELFVDLLMLAKHPLYVDDFLGGFRVYASSITGSNRMRGLYRAYERERFELLMGRPWRKSDWILWALYRARKHLMNPRALKERLIRGPIPAQ